MLLGFHVHLNLFIIVFYLPSSSQTIVAQFDASELITQREMVSMRIREDLVKRGRHFNIFMDDISIVRSPDPFSPPAISPNLRKFFLFSQVDLTFGREFTQAVEQKQVGKH